MLADQPKPKRKRVKHDPNCLSNGNEPVLPSNSTRSSIFDDMGPIKSRKISKNSKPVHAQFTPESLTSQSEDQYKLQYLNSEPELSADIPLKLP